MPRLRKLTRYPIAFLRLFERASKREVVVPCASPAAVRTLRAELYFFRRALRLEAARRKSGKLTAAAEMAQSVALHVEGSALVAKPKVTRAEIAVQKAIGSSE